MVLEAEDIFGIQVSNNGKIALEFADVDIRKLQTTPLSGFYRQDYSEWDYLIHTLSQNSWLLEKNKQYNFYTYESVVYDEYYNVLDKPASQERDGWFIINHRFTPEKLFEYIKVCEVLGLEVGVK